MLYRCRWGIRIIIEALALNFAKPNQVRDMIVIGGTGHHIQVRVLDAEVSIGILRVEVSIHTCFCHNLFRGCTLRLHVPNAHVVGKDEIYACRVVASV